MSAARRFLEDAIAEKKRQLSSVLDGPTRGTTPNPVDVGEPPPPSVAAPVRAVRADNVVPFRGPMAGDAPAPLASAVPQPTRGTMDAGVLTPEPVDSTVPARVDVGAAPTMILRNNKGRPIGVARGGDSLAEDVDLLNAQRGYQAPHSTKDLVKSLVFGFLQHGLPGAAASGIGYEMDQPTRNRMAVGQDMAQTQQRVSQAVAMRNQQNDWSNDESQRAYRDAQSYRVMNPVRPGFNLSPGQHRVEIDPKTGQPIDVANLPDRPTRDTPHNPLLRERVNQDGSKTTLQSDDYGKTWKEAPGLESAAPPVAPDVSALNAPDIQSLSKQLQSDQAELAQHQQEIAKKHGAWKQQAEVAYEAALSDYKAAASAYAADNMKPKPGTPPNRKDFYDRIQNNDPDYLSGDYESVANRVKELQGTIKENKDKVNGLQREVRAAGAKPTRGGSTYRPSSDGKYHYTPAQIRAALKPGQTYEGILNQLKANPQVVLDQ